MTMDLALVLTDTLQLADSSSGSGDGVHPALLAFLAGPAFYMYMYRRYRNKDKRHGHELETPTSKFNLKKADRHQRSLVGVSHRKMRDANNTAVHGSSVSGRGRNFLKGLFN